MNYCNEELETKALSLRLKLEIYFSLNKSQQRKFNSKHSWNMMHLVSYADMAQITRSKKILNMFSNFKDL